MGAFRYSVEAEQDVTDIIEYTFTTWGWRQAAQYLDRLEAGFGLIAQSPSIGRSCEFLRPGLKRFEIGHHVVFYSIEPEGVVIGRVLHERMLPANYL